MIATKQYRSFFLISIAGIFLFLAGCTTTTIRPELVYKPAGSYDAVVVGELNIQGKTWGHLLPHFRQGMVKALTEAKAFKNILADAKQPRPDNAIVITGTITKIDPGDVMARILIGFGAGAAEVEGKFEIHNMSGAPLVRFTAAESYAGGAGIGGWDMVRMEELLQNFGAAAARSIVRWSQGKTLTDPAEAD